MRRVQLRAASLHIEIKVRNINVNRNQPPPAPTPRPPQKEGVGLKGGTSPRPRNRHFLHNDRTAGSSEAPRGRRPPDFKLQVADSFPTYFSAGELEMRYISRYVDLSLAERKPRENIQSDKSPNNPKKKCSSPHSALRAFKKQANSHKSLTYNETNVNVKTPLLR
ncbi:hypothetical protein EVAR_38190_1 [Eumeta japonica]|uniref:Uncharacterized protein n=1 Tax=Eumeta variegata TaxID=151549 RepID=A0A4C1WFZ9_EUMVA|nr:hypothetical protein EVAR_38190_1 [Eumeta japonica]